MPLRDWQYEPANRLREILAIHHTAIDESETGTGKTYVAAFIAANNHLPTLVVGPKVARATWERAAESFGDRFSFVGYEMLRTGNTDFGKWTGGANPREKYFKCQCCQRKLPLQNFEPCYCHPIGIHCVELKAKPHRYGKFVFHPAVKQIIFDEAHRCNGMDSLNADMLIAAKQQGIRTLALSATPACSPLQMRALGYLLDLHNLNSDIIREVRPGMGIGVRPSFYRWIRKKGCTLDPAFHGWKWLVSADFQREIMNGIRDEIIPARGVRVCCDTIPGFPECDIQAELYSLDDPATLEKVYGEMAASLSALASRQEQDKNPESKITILLRGRQKVELLKVPIAVELGQDSLDKGMSVVFFVNFRQTIEELCKRFPEALVIDGTTVKTRDASLEKFQVNVCRTLVVNNEAGGVALSMQDLDGFHPRMGYVFPNFSATSMRQVFGRLPRDGGKSRCHYRVIFADCPTDRTIHCAVSRKLDNQDALTDSDWTPPNLRFA